MHMKKRVAGAGALIMLLVLALMPLSALMELGSKSGKTAEEVYEPLLNIHNQIVAEKAQDGVPVGDLIELEDAWAIEDTREESMQPLVTAMLNGSDVLGFDEADNTFYCTLGMEAGDEWPEIRLKARNAPDGLNIRLVDDYTYDWCSDAIREGYRYEMLAYTDTQYNYFGVVFTGMPIVSLCVEDLAQLSDEYIPARTAISAAGQDAIDHTVMIHLRGGGFDIYKVDKKSYRLEFHEIDSNGKDRKKEISVLGMEADTDWLLIGNGSDKTSVRNQLCWELWNRWKPSGEAFGQLGSKLVEVFVNNEYKGIFQLMQRYDIEKEMQRRGTNPQNGYVYRTVHEQNTDPQRPIFDYRGEAAHVIELRHKPEHASMKTVTEIVDDYVKMNERISDEEFARLVEEHIDVESIIEYYLFHQAADLSNDNVQNNLYIWAIRNADGGYTFELSPWDMDLGLTSREWEDAQDEQEFLNMPIPRRILDLNLRNSRQILWEIWNEKRSTILTDDAIYQWIMNMEDYINQSGAGIRNSLKWYGEAEPLDLALMMSNETSHMTKIEYYMQGLWPLDGMAQ